MAGDNEILVQSAGMDIKAPAFSPTDVPGQPQALIATAGDRDGEIDIATGSHLIARIEFAGMLPGRYAAHPHLASPKSERGNRSRY